MEDKYDMGYPRGRKWPQTARPRAVHPSNGREAVSRVARPQGVEGSQAWRARATLQKVFEESP
jgi:hypothetical protein